MFPSDSRPLTITRPSLISASVIIVGPRDEADLAQAQRLVRGIGELLLSFRWLQSDRLSSSHNHIKGVVNTCQFLRRNLSRKANESNSIGEVCSLASQRFTGHQC
jgi:hypothetical protein